MMHVRARAEKINAPAFAQLLKHLSSRTLRPTYIQPESKYLTGNRMRFLHTMVRIHDIEQSLDFYCNKMGLQEVRRLESEQGRFTLIFLAAPKNLAQSQAERAPELELTYNWPDENGKREEYTGGRNFGHLAYKVDNIYATCQKLMDHGVTINRPPRDGRMAFVRSPDGISIELLQEGEALAPAEPWASMGNTGVW
jgi:lactoylglutathione lyase